MSILAPQGSTPLPGLRPEEVAPSGQLFLVVAANFQVA